MKTSRVQRILKIITALQSTERYSISDLQKLLGTSRRTVFRDLRALNKIGVPCYFDPESRSYAIAEKYFLAAPDLSKMETLGLLLLTRKAREHICLPLSVQALYATMKIENNLGSKVKSFCGNALEYITIISAPQVKAGPIDKLFLKLIEAISKRQVVRIRYRLSHRQNKESFNFRPYHLLYNEYAWNVIGELDDCSSVRTFRLDRIEELQLLNEIFILCEEFNIREYIGRAWSMQREGRLYHVKLKFSPEVAGNVTDIQWHSTQNVSFERDGSAIVEFRVDGLDEIKRWILSYGDRVQVLAPKILQKMIIETARNIVKQNGQLLPV